MDDGEEDDKDDGSGIEVEGSPASGLDGDDGGKPDDEEDGNQAGGFGGDDGTKPDDSYIFSHGPERVSGFAALPPKLNFL